MAKNRLCEELGGTDHRRKLGTGQLGDGQLGDGLIGDRSTLRLLLHVNIAALRPTIGLLPRIIMQCPNHVLGDWKLF